MSTIAILTDEEKLAYDYPPILTVEARALCFSIPPELEYKINHLRTATNMVGFLLQYGYFRVCKRFFNVNRFQQEDIEYVAKILGISIDEINLNNYKNNIPAVHQGAILEQLKYKHLDQSSLAWLECELERHIKRLIDPRKLFFTALDLLNDRKIALPSYRQLSELIAKYYLGYEKYLLKAVKLNLRHPQQEMLNELLHVNDEGSQGKLNQFKVINQSLKPKAIQASLNVFSQIEGFFNTALPLISALSLTSEGSQYYATWVKKAKLSQLKQFSDQNKLFLHLAAFCQNQYYLRQDSFVDIFLKSVQSVKNSVNSRITKIDQLSRKERHEAIVHITKNNRKNRETIDEITDILRSVVLTDSVKIRAIIDLLDKCQQKNHEEQAKMDLFEQSLDRMAKDCDFFNMLEKYSVKLQNRVSGILKILVFNEDNSDKNLMEAINYYKLKDGKLDHHSPTAFFTPEEKEALSSPDGKFNISLYKILLFMHVSDAIKSGELNLKHSYRYLSIDEYLVNKATWEKDKSQLLESTGLQNFNDYESIMQALKRVLGDKYEGVNRHFQDNLNPYLSFNKDGKFHVNTPALDDKQTEHIAALLNQGGQTPILKVLNVINSVTNFTKCFTHHNIKNAKRFLNAEICMAGIIGLGCNIGVPKMGKISSGINENTLKNTVNWYFSYKALQEANDQIIALINKLSLPNVFIVDPANPHSSSDGQKVNVAVESLLANFSFKYFGKGKGVSVYTFIDEKQVLFHSTVISASEREAAYVIDGLNNNDVVKTRIHSTDTHGYTELIFAATHFMDTAFAPRIKDLAGQAIYAFSAKSTYEKKGYKILPSRSINQKLIANHWDDILRFMVTIKLKRVSASQLFKRLSSYARNNPLYKAIKEFGRIIKSIFILTYIDDVKLRQRIEKQLNRVELSNKFSSAVFYANSSEFKQGSPDEQQIIVACKVLIQNSIILWNYLYLSELLVNCQDEEERTEMIGLIKEGSILSWGHVNLHGEFDFRRRAANDNAFDMVKILSLILA